MSNAQSKYRFIFALLYVAFQIDMAVTKALGTPQMFFDADHTFFDKRASTQRFEGNVVAIAAKILISADSLKVDRAKNQISGQGHIVVISSKQVISGDTFVYDSEKGEFTLTNAMILINDAELAKKLVDDMMGFNRQEMEFELARNDQLLKLEQEKSDIRSDFRRERYSSGFDIDVVIERYQIVLEKEKLIANQKNTSLASIAPERRLAYERRRSFWESSRNPALADPSLMSRVGYFAVEGQEIHKLDEERFTAKRAFITPCLCQENETPAWGFRAETINAQGGGYAELYHPIIEIKGIPVLYLPYIKLPLKSERQSGFLLPSISHSNINGSMYSQPIYFALDDHADATMTNDLFERRGLRLGLEYRLQAKRHSGWEVQAEAIRDQNWLSQQENRRRISDQYRQGAELAKSAHELAGEEDSSFLPDKSGYESLSDPGWWKRRKLSHCLSEPGSILCQQNEIDNHLQLPSNTWRGQLKWRGQSIIAPRLSFMSHGLLLSDHRYQGDLWVPSFAQLEGAAPVNLYASSRARIHLDAKNFYLGVGSHFSDPVLALEQFSGYQVPVYLKIQSRMFALTHPDSPFPLYFQGKVEQRRIEVFKESIFAQTLPQNQALQRLGNGSWQKFDLNITSPLNSRQIIQADFFADFEYRGVGMEKIHTISHILEPGAPQARSSNKSSYSFLHTVASGIHFNLPLDGTWRREKPHSRGFALIDQKDIAQVVKHQMNWDITFTLRPYAASRGSYGKTSEYVDFYPETQEWKQVRGSRKLVYYPSDQELYSSQQITFKTSHDWSVFQQAWSLNPPEEKVDKIKDISSEEKSPEINFREQARQELMFSLDRPIHGSEDMLTDANKWKINRYHLINRKQLNPLHIEAQISFDYLKLEQRENQKKINSSQGLNLDLPEPWTPFWLKTNIAHRQWILNVDGYYNIYKSMLTKVSSHLQPPPFLQSQLGLQYLISQDPIRTEKGGFTIQASRTRVIALETGIVPNFTTSISYGIEKKDSEDAKKMASFASSYISPSRCWGLKTGWTKNFTDETWDGNYYLGLVVNFFNFPKTFGNMASRFNSKV